MRLISQVIFTVGLYCAQPAFAGSFAFQATDEVHQAFDRLDYAQKTSDALDGMIITAGIKLREEGYSYEADQITGRYFNEFQGFMFRQHNMQGIGDHDPIKWMLNTWQTLDSLLGSQAMQLMHLDDIRIFAYTIPVVFWCVDNVDAQEFRAHFVGGEDGGFAGSTAYWVTMLSCTVGTYGTATSLMCSPMGMLAEEITDRVIAPRLSDRVWARSCGQ